jgi:hypothetical protein
MRRIVPLFCLSMFLLVPSVALGDPTVGPGGGTPGTSANFDLIGHDPLYSRGLNAAPAMFGDHLYVGNRTDGSSRCGDGDPRESSGPDSCPHIHPGILIVDISDPSNPRVVGEIGPPYAGNVNETTRELRVWPRQELLIVASFTCSAMIHSCPGDTVDPSFRFFDLSDPAHPAFLTEWKPTQANGVVRTPHEFYLWQDPGEPGRALLWISTPTTSMDPEQANMLIADISEVPTGEPPTLIAQGNWNNQFVPRANLALHSMTPTLDGRVTHLAYLSGYFLMVDTAEVADETFPPGAVVDLNDNLLTPATNAPVWVNANPGHSAVPFVSRPYSLVTDEVYGTFALPSHGCPWGWVHTLDVSDPANPTVVGEYRIPEDSCPPPSAADQERTSYASHNPTITENLALITWHSGGLQAVDISNPAQMGQGGWVSPTPLPTVANEDPALSMGDNKVVMWSFPIIKNGLIYVVDLRNGLYVLRYTGPQASEISGVDFLEGNSNVGQVEDPPVCAGVEATRFSTSPGEALSGTESDDILVGDVGNEVIDGLGGNDLICAGAGADVVKAHGGNDRVFGEKGKDRLKGGPGRDRLKGGGAKDRCRGGPGKDTAQGCEKKKSI